MRGAAVAIRMVVAELGLSFAGPTAKFWPSYSSTHSFTSQKKLRKTKRTQTETSVRIAVPAAVERLTEEVVSLQQELADLTKLRDTLDHVAKELHDAKADASCLNFKMKWSHDKKMRDEVRPVRILPVP